ncbi:DNA topoisomerase VI subunit B [Candidatus Micrarchaeota archaeon]|nr:DNA topoisomerase VI subunit B [Candidatus Micrarchaeota archaeon]
MPEKQAAQPPAPIKPAAPKKEQVLSEEQLSKEFREYSVAEFFKRNRQMLGYSSKVRSLTTIVHEYVTNSLDACEEAGILPEITVEVQSGAALPREEVIAVGDATTRQFDVPLEIYDADVLDFFIDGIKQAQKKEYDLRSEKRGKDSVKTIVFKNAPIAGAKITARFAQGHLKVITEDNGTGIPKKNVGQALGMLLAGTKFHQRRQKRGQQGIGASYAILFAQITTGKTSHVKTGIGDGKVYECDISIDIKLNKPAILNEREYSGKFRGVRVESEFSEVTYNRSEYSVYEYLRRTALANPHAQITLIEPDKNIVVFPRVTKDIPKKPEPCLPHPLGISTNDLMEMAQSTQARKISSFLTSEFSRFSSDKVKELAALVPQVNLERAPKALAWPEAEKLIQAIQRIKWIAPETDVLQPIGDTQIEKALKNLLKPEKMKVIARKPKVFRGGIPFLVEAAIAYGGNAGAGYAGEEVREGHAAGKLEILRYANRTPLLFDSGNCGITEAVKTIDWNRYDLKDLENQPVSIFVNFVSVYVPYTGAGKLAISAEEEIVEEIRFALMECAREIALYLHSMQKVEDQEHRRSIFVRYIDEVAEALHDITGKPQAFLAEKLKQLAKEKTALMDAKEEEGEKLLEKMEETEEKGFEEEGESKEE